MTAVDQNVLSAISQGEHNDPFSVLGPHEEGRNLVVRTFQPQVEAVSVVDRNDAVLADMTLVYPGLFEATISTDIGYRLRLSAGGNTDTIDDPYRFPSPLGDIDRYLLGEGTHLRLYEKLGARSIELDGVVGVHFAVWAPNAQRVSLVGPFNEWDGRRHVMRAHPDNGVWDIFIPGLVPGELYKFEIKGSNGDVLPLKSDPFGRRFEPPPGNASIVPDNRSMNWEDKDWLASRAQLSSLDAPMSIYEVHLGSWCQSPENQHWMSYKQLADELVPYVKEMGYTHIEVLPITEHPFDGSWGYQPIGMYAPTWRFGTPHDFKVFVDQCHREGISVILDWVPAHFPRDTHGLGEFDGTHLYEHADPRQGAHSDWGTLIFNYGRKEVVNYLLANALFWLEEFHIDVLRVDAVASMLYLDYSREHDQWIPNEHGGNQNLEVVEFLKQMNTLVHSHGGMTIAEESTSWPMVSRPVYLGGLGFTYKWNMGWMNDTLNFFKEEPIHRRFHQGELNFSLTYAFSENFVLPLSHDEVVHGKGSMLTRMPGDAWQQFANLRLFYTFMYGHPGKKLMFMGCEFGQRREWNFESALDWALLDDPQHAGIQRLVRDLNQLYQMTPALYERDCEAEGFEWIDCTDNEHSVIAFIRRAKVIEDCVVIVCNFTPMVHEQYRIGVPGPGTYQERLNSDSSSYAGSGVGNPGGVMAEAICSHGQSHSLSLTLPPLAALVLQAKPAAS
ncbi:1,4-alpha-glucan branching protein GlgB [Granulosicoccus antarcticus]|uniref:1,4-alpha-glucan branching enzyme GlgB n=1 Tax=Granulosicoccus antarcticus IMCC3135 TaxID=1192854 RepID=A0A2Z2NR11_9GAMM|nr:1,4-alpha-glucan branching protein GlgB [Granulosicoccus antarcticus]ASJ73669.1 1,4-alpha-glucan branching enzyme GlgB [Granulosicoccus antarcticus IMCC3135]